MTTAPGSEGQGQPHVGLVGLLLPFLLVVLLSVAVAFLAMHWRAHLLKWLASRRGRLVFETVVPGILSIVGAILLEAINWSTVFTGTPSADDHKLLWGLSLVTFLAVAVLAVTVVHGDTVELERRRLVEEHEKEVTAERVKVEDARSMRQFYWTVNEAFLRVVSQKRERLLKSASGARLKALEPPTQNQALIDACWEIVNGLINPNRNTTHRVRVTYFRVVDGRLEPHICYDGTSHDCVSSSLTQPQVRKLFVLEEGKPGCLAVAASKTGATYWVPDAEIANNDAREAFTYFDEPTEKDALKSIVALPIAIQEDGQPFDVITIDTDLRGYFHGSDPVQKEQFKFLQKNLAHRLQLEKSLESDIEGVVSHG